MPELPEVETIKRDLSSIVGSTIRSVTVRDPMLVESERDLGRVVSGWTIRELDRRGKYLLVLGDEGFLLFSLRMTGNVTFREPGDGTQRYVEFNLGEESIYFSSVRRFSRVHCYRSTEPDSTDKIGRLGVDPLNGEFSVGFLADQFSNRSAAVKSLLMNQELVAGIGNIYANEICFEAGVQPDKSVVNLDESELESIVQSTPEVLEEAIESRGSSISDYSRPDGESGLFQDNFMVYGRPGEDCFECSSTIEKTEVSGRSTFFCPECQG